MPLEASWWAEIRSLLRIEISHQLFEISSKVYERNLTYNMPSMRRLWRNECFLWRNAFLLYFDDVHYFQNLKTYRDIPITVGIYWNKAVFWLISSITVKKFILHDIRKSRTTLDAPWWAEFRSLFKIEISHQLFEISSKVYVINLT